MEFTFTPEELGLNGESQPVDDEWNTGGNFSDEEFTFTGEELGLPDTSHIQQPAMARSHGPQPQKQQQPKEPGFISNAIASFGKGTQSVIGLPVDIMTGAMNVALPEKYQIKEPVGGSQWLNRMTGDYKPQGISGRFSEALGEMIPIPGGASAVNALIKVGKATKGVNALAKMNAPGAKELAKEAALTLPSTVGAAVGTTTARELDLGPAGEIGGAIAGGTLGASRSLKKAIAPHTTHQEVLNQAKYNYQKAIRPPKGGTVSASQYKANMDKAAIGMEEIVHNNRAMNKSMPDSLVTFAEGVEEARKNVFKEYSALSKDATSKGLTVNIEPVIKDLEQMKSSKAVKAFGRQTVKHVDDLIDQVKAFQSGTPSEIEDAIRLLNQDVKGFYSGRNVGLNESSAGITDTVARYLRATLDDTIEKATGQEYQALKNRYGALRSIEKDVTGAAIRDATSSGLKLADFSDMFSISKGVYAVSKLDPAGAAAAAAMYSTKRWLKKAADPNKKVRKLFKNLDNKLPKREKWTGIPEREPWFEMRARTPDEVIPGTKALVPTGKSRQQVVDAQYTNARIDPKQKALPYDMSKTRSPGGTASKRKVTRSQTVHDKANFDWDAAMKDLIDKGYKPAEAQRMLLRQIKSK